MNGDNNKEQREVKYYKLNEAQYRQKLRNEERLIKLKKLIKQASSITRQISDVTTKRKYISK